MTLRDDEERRLAEIERHLLDEESRLAATTECLNDPVADSAHRVSRFTRIVVEVLVVWVIGLTVIVAGVTVSSGFLVFLGAVLTAAFPLMYAWYSWLYREKD